MRLRHPFLALATVFLFASAASSQDKGQPGRFDFYLMNLSWSPEFCSIQGTSPECSAHPGFILHGLWTQNNDGTYPIFCSEEPAPANLAQNLDITPDLALLHHEWAKHGTCSGVGPQRFFSMEHQAFRALKIPPQFEHIDHEISLTPDAILGLFAAANPDSHKIASCLAAAATISPPSKPASARTSNPSPARACAAAAPTP